jgi:hypothetical protein
MDKTLRLIDQLIAEHKTVGKKTQSLEKAIDDIRLLSGLKDERRNNRDQEHQSFR